MQQKLPGYAIFRELTRDTKHVTYRGVRENDQTPVLIKTSANPHPTLDEVARLKNEFELLSHLSIPATLKAYSLDQHQNNYYLILEDPQSKTLDKFIAGKNLDIGTKLKIAIKIVKSLGELQENEIIHKNIQPENILIDETIYNAKIIGFDFATKIPRQRLSLKNPNLLEGSLPYISPEQTGRMNREVDYRTDFYSLGVTFYELFTAKLPFVTTDPMELIHAHIAKSPKPPSEVNPTVPLMISNIIMKLMAKKAEDRYSSSLSLLNDLEKSLEEWTLSGTIDPFPLGTNDVYHKLQISQKIYGREKEIQTILLTFEEVCRGSTQMVLLGGYPGIGKTSIVHELHKPLLEHKGFFISGKFDQYKTNTPYSAFIEAFQDLIQQILTENDDTIAMWREKLKAALGVNTQIIVDVIPELRYILGTTVPTVEYDSQETQNRFNFFFQKFISLYASKESPLVIFLDDLQWADHASLQLIEMTLTTLKTSGLLLIGAYRSNEVTPLHPLKTTEERIIKAGGIITELEVLPLNVKSVNQLISDTLHLNPETAQELCQILYKKTQGNPFFINQFLTYLYEENLLYVDPKEGRWVWDKDKIEMLDVSDNVVDLLITKLQKFPIELQEIMEVAAAIGNRFDANLVATVLDKPLDQVLKSLLEVIQEGLILPSEDIQQHLYLDSREISKSQQKKPLSREFRFLHDKVQQASFQLMSEEDREKTHYKIGLILFKKYKGELIQEHIFEVMAQLNPAKNLISKQEEKLEYAKLNLIAAQKAMRTVAFQTALNFLEVGIEFLPKNHWKTEYDLSKDLYLLAAEANYLVFNFDEANRLFDIILTFAKSIHDKALVYSLKIKLNVSSVQYEEAIKWGKEGLKLFGIKLPSRNLKFFVIIELIKVKFHLIGKNREILAAMPTITDPNHFDIIYFLYSLITPTYLTNKDLFALVTLKGLNLSLSYGNTPMTAYIYATYGIILTALFEDFNEGHEFGLLANEINRKYKDQKYIPPTKFLVGSFLNPAQSHLKESLEILQTGFDIGTRLGDFINAVFNLGMLMTAKYMLALPLNEVWPEILSALEYVTKIKSHNRGYIFNSLRQVIMALRGETTALYSMESEDFNEEAFFQMLKENNFPVTLYFAYTFKIQICVFAQNYELGIEFAKRCEPYTYCSIGQPMRVFNDFYHALCLTGNYPWKDLPTQRKFLKKIKEILGRLKTWSKGSPSNYSHLYFLVKAEYSKLTQDKESAVENYDKAIESAKENGYIQNEGIAEELFAGFYLSQNRPHIAKQYLIDARYAYYRWGATAKTKELEKRYPQIFAIGQTSGKEDEAALSERGASSSSIDLMAVIKATQSISGEILLNKLLDQLMQIVVETAGAEKAILILERDSKWLVEAEYSTKQKEAIVLQGLPYKEKGEDLAIAVVNYVIRTQELVVLDDASKESLYAQDPYIISQKPQSILCFPLLHVGKLIGILYLENNLSTKVFTPDRVELLKLLAAQIATSLENSLLYSQQKELSSELKDSNDKLGDYSQNLEKKVYDRTRELNEKNKQLEETLQQIKEMQKKLIQQEKLVSLVAVTKGIATEMRNPLNYIYNFSTLSQNLLKELKSDVKTKEAVESLALVEKNLLKINEHSKKADDIITSMIDDSRESEGQRELTDINKLIRDYADLVYYNYYKKDPLFSLTIKTDYDESIGKITVVPQNLGRVFYNIIDNACYATALKKKEVGGDFSPIISIKTINEGENVKVIIWDNGVGIPKEILSRIFSPFLTTKPSGKGAGMGLSISHDIVTQEHGGTISIQSEPGNHTEVTVIIPKFWVGSQKE